MRCFTRKSPTRDPTDSVSLRAIGVVIALGILAVVTALVVFE